MGINRSNYQKPILLAALEKIIITKYQKSRKHLKNSPMTGCKVELAFDLSEVEEITTENIIVDMGI